MYKLGVIPAAGEASRWNDRELTDFLKGAPKPDDPVVKELLPLMEATTLIDHSVEALGKVCDTVLIVTNAKKIDALSEHLDGVVEPQILFMHQNGEYDMWSAMRTSLSIAAEHYYMSMPDTVYPVDTFLSAPEFYPEAHFAMGCFFTERSGRFGMLRGGLVLPHIVNKDVSGGPGWAWGVLTWSRVCAYKWISAGITNYTDAINLALKEYGLHTWEMEHYFDFANRAEFDRYNQSITRGEIPTP